MLPMNGIIPFASVIYVDFAKDRSRWGLNETLVMIVALFLFRVYVTILPSSGNLAFCII